MLKTNNLQSQQQLKYSMR